ncbi:MAG: stage II sporulation protein R [Clostridia bacterium]|nr:stage II sporulation protein R [Clostridia bacterium]
MKTRKTIITAFIALMLLAVAVLTLCACDFSDLGGSNQNRATSQQQLAESCIRIHIRANSNDGKDQAVKLLVRDAITDYLEGALANCKTKAEASSVLSNSRNKLIAIANTTLKNNGFSYTSSMRIGNEYFPDRIYDGYDFPAGNYDAVVINLGTGTGDNWWCVAFPPLCFVPDSENGEKVEYKSWVKELLDKIFN